MLIPEYKTIAVRKRLENYRKLAQVLLHQEIERFESLRKELSRQRRMQQRKKEK